MGLLSSLTREQKEAVGLLQIGTFLEYFDLMLYIHMAVLLNELFFPKTDPHTAALLAAFTFCSTYVMRPIGALIFGWIGDNIGRRSTIIVTTVMMAVSCAIMANLPTYAEIGIYAGWIMIICRIVQGMSSMGEIIGAQIYISEILPRPQSYSAVAFVAIAASIGASFALGVATLVTSFYMNWRIAFWIGAGIAFVGAMARTRLRETPEFLNLKRQQMKEAIEALSGEADLKNPKAVSRQKKPTWKEPIKTKTIVSFLLIHCGFPLSFYLAYIYFNPILKENYDYSPENIITHNFFLSLVLLASFIVAGLLSSRFHPIKILKVRWIFSSILMILMPFFITSINSASQLFLLQAAILLLNLTGVPADAVLYYHLPIFRRVTFASFLYALSRALMYIITSFGLVYFGSYFGNYGLWVISLPITIGYLFGVLHFEQLERKVGVYPNMVRV